MQTKTLNRDKRNNRNKSTLQLYVLQNRNDSC